MTRDNNVLYSLAVLVHENSLIYLRKINTSVQFENVDFFCFRIYVDRRKSN